MLVHHNLSAQNINKPLYMDELTDALCYNRNTKIIWSHVGISRRIELEELLIIAGQVLMDMRVALIERYPDRVMIGSGKVGHWETYPSEITKYYPMIDRLKPETAEKLTHENILRLVKTIQVNEFSRSMSPSARILSLLPSFQTGYYMV